MTHHLAKRFLTGGGSIAVLLCTSWPALLAQEAILDGVFALPGIAQAVTGKLEVVETGPLSRQIELTYADMATGEQIADFDVELTQRLHILATDAALAHLIHQHADEIGVDGSFTAELQFPAPGLYHIYTDAVPTGIGQQVLRFDVLVGDDATPTGEPKPGGADISSGPLLSSDGPYTVTLDASQLRAGAQSAVSLLVEKDGAPATDLAPYLGVSAHAVFIRTEDLAYVHAHATPADGQDHHNAAPAADAPQHDTGHGDGNAPAAGHGDHGAAPAHEGGHADQGAAAAPSVSPEMSLHVTPPAAGSYALWIEFIGGEAIRTVPFTIEIPDADQGASN